jgi:tyrosyl-tRNA synthetase
MSIPDALLRQWFDLLTDRSESEIATLLLQPMAAKKRLGKDIAGYYHGEPAAIEAEAEWVKRFSEREDPTEIQEVRLPAGEITDGKIWVVQLLVLLGLVKSKNEARRNIEGGAVTTGADREKVTDCDAQIAVTDGLIVRVGKRRVVKVRL